MSFAPPRNILIKDRDCTNGESFTVSTGIVSTADTIICVYIDYWFYGNQNDTASSAINNIICIGKNAQNWNDYCTRLYTGQNNNLNQMLLVAFNDGDQAYKNVGSIMRHNKIIVRINYSTGRTDFYINGQTIAKNFGAWGTGGQSDALGEIVISNAEGSHRSYSFYNEISILGTNNWTDEMFESFTEVEKYNLSKIVCEKLNDAKKAILSPSSDTRVDEAAIAGAERENTESTFGTNINWDASNWATALGAATVLNINYHLTTVQPNNTSASFWNEPNAILWRTGCVNDDATVNDETLAKQIANLVNNLSFASDDANWDYDYKLRAAYSLSDNQTSSNTNDDHYIVCVGIICNRTAK